MKIGIYCTNGYPYPVPAGTVMANITIAGSLADALVDLNEDVTLFAPVGTTTKAKLETFGMLPFSSPEVNSKYPHVGSSYEYENLMLVQALNHSTDHNFDIFHSHTRPFSIASFAALKPNLPVITTVHDPLTDSAFNLLPLFNQFTNLHFVSLSADQQTTCPTLSWEAIVQNGINQNAWKFNPNPENYLLFVGRIMPEKGPDIAVQVARSLKLPLKLCGPIYDHHKPFFAEKIAPFLNSDIEYLGSVSPEELNTIYGSAQALLMPTSWHEPFGLVAIEAMATGTPVIALNKGSMKEIISDKKTGFLVDSFEEMVAAVKKIPSLSRQDCRLEVEQKFTTEVMATNYLTLYKKILKNHQS